MVLAANASDVEAAKEADLPGPLQKRLGLSGKLEGLVRGLQDLQGLPDPLGVTLLRRSLSAHGPELRRVSCPIGVLLIVFESRPDAVVQIASLCIKAGNAVILKGGKEADSSNRALVEEVLRPALEAAGLPADAVQLVHSRGDVSALLALHTLIDLVIPRGSAQLVRSVQSSTKIPVMGHSDGLCSVYLHHDAAELGTRAVEADEAADAASSGPTAAAHSLAPGVSAARLVVDSKTQYAAACNAAETLLVHEALLAAPAAGAGGGASAFGVVTAALLASGVTLHCDEACLPVAAAVAAALDAAFGAKGAAAAAVTNKAAEEAVRVALSAVVRPDAVEEARKAGTVAAAPLVLAAAESAWDQEWLGPAMSVHAVGGLEDAAAHVAEHGSGHTDVIVTADPSGAGAEYQQRVGSASVFVNMSSRFADGFRFGFGAEVGISTARLHARGPVGLEGLTTYKYLAHAPAGTAAYVGEYEGGGATRVDAPREWSHSDL